MPLLCLLLDHALGANYDLAIHLHVLCPVTLLFGGDSVGKTCSSLQSRLDPGCHSFVLWFFALLCSASLLSRLRS